MGLSQYWITFAVSILLFTTNISAQQPKPCCPPKTYTTGLSAVTQVTGLHPYVSTEDGTYYYDQPNNRLAANITVTNDTSVYQAQLILDYGKHTQYTIVDGKTCYKTPLDGPFPNECVPDKAKFKGTVKYGQTLAANRWFFIVAPYNMTQRISMTVDNCMPVTSTTLLNTEGQQSFEARDFYDFKEGIENPSKVFTPPKICDKASVKANTKIPDEFA